MSDSPADEQLQDCLRHQDAIGRIGALALADCDESMLARTVVELAQRSLHADHAEIWAMQPSGALAIQARAFAPGLAAELPEQNADDGGFALAAWDSRRALIVADWEREQRCQRPALLSRRQVLSSIAVLIGAPTQPSGVLAVHFPRPEAASGAVVRGRVEGFAGLLALDASRRRSERRLQRYRQLEDSAPDGWFVLDEQGSIYAMNPGARSLLRVVDTPEREGLSLWDWQPEWAARQLREEGMPEARRDGRWRNESVMRRADGRELPVELLLVPDAAAASPERRFTLVARDISAMKRLEILQRGEEQVLERLGHGAELPDVLATLLQTWQAAEPGLLAAVSLPDDDGFLRLVAAPGMPRAFLGALDGLRIAADAGSSGSAAYGLQTVIAEDVLNHPFWQAHRDAARRAGIRAAWARPILDDGNRLLGVVSFHYPQRRAFTPEDAEQLRHCGRLVWVVLERYRGEQALQASQAHYRALYQDSQALLFTVDGEGRILDLSRGAARALGYRRSELKGMTLERLTVAGPEGESGEGMLMRGLAALPAGQYWRTALRSRDGEQFGVRMRVRQLPSQDGQALLIHCEELAPVAEMEGGHGDPLLELAGRDQLEARLDRLLARRSGAHGLCYLALDRISELRQACGDADSINLFRQVAALLRQCVRQRDTLAEVGDGEFAVLLEHCAFAEANTVAEQMRQRLEAFRFVSARGPVTAAASVGLVALGPEPARGREVLRLAEAAAHAARDTGGGRVFVYSTADTELARRYGEIQWAARLRAALAGDAFELYVQPIVPLAGSRRAGERYEVLLRLRDGDGPPVAPAVFMPAAERFALGAAIDQWVVEHALRWLEEHPERAGRIRRLSINLSAGSLADREFADYLRGRLEASPVESATLGFELDEAAVTANPEGARALLNVLKPLGCGLTLDSFGGGLAAFGGLRELPIDTLKIAGDYVAGMLDDTLELSVVTAVSDIGHLMGKAVHAGHVETPATLDRLRSIGVDYAQGHLVGRPAPLSGLN